MSDTHNAAPTPNATPARPVAALAGMAAVAVGTMLAANRANALTLTFNDNIPGTGDIKVLNYALALEDFESALYQAAIAKLPSLGASAGNAIFDYATKFAVVEADHAAFLRGAITAAGGTPISKFTYNFSSITGAADARAVLELLLQVEATGVRAYIGAVPLFSSKSAYLQTAAAIQGTEARHTSILTIVRNTLYATTTNVSSLTQDGSAIVNLNYDTIGYSAANPNEGYKGIDVALSPNAVLTAIGPFFVAPA